MNKKVGLVSFTNLVNEILVVFVQKVKLKSQIWIVILDENLNSEFQFGILENSGNYNLFMNSPNAI